VCQVDSLCCADCSGACVPSGQFVLCRLLRCVCAKWTVCAVQTAHVRVCQVDSLCCVDRADCADCSCACVPSGQFVLCRLCRLCRLLMCVCAKWIVCAVQTVQTAHVRVCQVDSLCCADCADCSCACVPSG
jgi:hypothetical protein